MQTKAVVFDWDGTLFDSMAYKRENFIILFLKFSIERNQLAEFHRQASGLPRKDLFNGCLKHFKNHGFAEAEYAEISSQYTSMNIESSAQVCPFADVRDVLEMLTKMKIKLFVSSSSAHDELMLVVARSGLNKYFLDTLGSQDNLKKGPQHIDYICGKYNLNKNNILFVGDDEKDILLGAQAGVRSIRIVRDSCTGDGEIANLNEIMNLLN